MPMTFKKLYANLLEETPTNVAGGVDSGDTKKQILGKKKCKEDDCECEECSKTSMVKRKVMEAAELGDASLGQVVKRTSPCPECGGMHYKKIEHKGQPAWMCNSCFSGGKKRQIRQRRTFSEMFIVEAGQQAGKLELIKTPVEKARSYAESIFTKSSLDSEIPNFDKNYVFAQRQAGSGKTQRKDMPVIDAKDVKQFQKRLEKGYIDLSPPFANDNSKGNPFPEGLSGDSAKKFLENGLKVHDGDAKDDVIKITNPKVEVGKLKPIQKQIYYDKSINPIAENGAKGSASFFQNKTFFIVSSDNYIIDGHHRYLGAMLIDPKMKVQTVMIDLPIKTLLPMTLAYGDAVGNKRNK